TSATHVRAHRSIDDFARRPIGEGDFVAFTIIKLYVPGKSAPEVRLKLVVAWIFTVGAEAFHRAKRGISMLREFVPSKLTALPPGGPTPAGVPLWFIGLGLTFATGRQTNGKENARRDCYAKKKHTGVSYLTVCWQASS